MEKEIERLLKSVNYLFGRKHQICLVKTSFKLEIDFKSILEYISYQSLRNLPRILRKAKKLLLNKKLIKVLENVSKYQTPIKRYCAKSN